MPFNDWWDQSGASGGVSVPGSVAAPASPLYVGPSSRSNTFAVLGDSISAHNSVYAAPSPSASNVIAFNNYGYLAWARALSGGAISFNPVNNFGVGGDTIAPSTAGPGATTRVSQVIASGVKNCCVEIGINDIDLTPTPTPLSSMMSNTALICSQLVNAGVTVYLFTLVPCGSLNTAQWQNLLSFNTWIRQFALNTPGVILVDAYPYLNDYTVSHPNYRANYSYDNLHPGTTAAYFMGLALWNAVQRTLPGQSGQLCVSPGTDTYSSSSSVYGNLLSTGAFQGSSGTTSGVTASGASVSGTVATGWALFKNSGTATCTLTCSIETPRTDLGGYTNGSRQVIALSSTALTGGTFEQFQLNSSQVFVGTAYAAGDYVYAECVVEIDNPVAIYSAALNLQETHTVAYQNVFDMAQASPTANILSGLMPSGTGTYYLTLRTPVIQTQSNSQNLQLILYVYFYPNIAGGASGTFKFADAAIRHSAGWSS